VFISSVKTVSFDLRPPHGHLLVFPQKYQTPAAAAIRSKTAPMHQSDLYLPVPPIASRHVPPVRLPAAAPSSSTSAAWPQSFSNPAISKKRNIDRACDDCRRRKTRCDGPKMPDNVCTNCVQNRKICTYMLARTSHRISLGRS
jgi:Fungal Zn(2)-Cys(6) binuclear cluster domain